MLDKFSWGFYWILAIFGPTNQSRLASNIIFGWISRSMQTEFEVNYTYQTISMIKQLSLKPLHVVASSPSRSDTEVCEKWQRWGVGLILAIEQRANVTRARRQDLSTHSLSRARTRQKLPVKFQSAPRTNHEDGSLLRVVFFSQSFIQTVTTRSDPHWTKLHSSVQCVVCTM